MRTGAKKRHGKETDMGLCMCDGKFVNRNEVALVKTPERTDSWKPVPHIDVIDAVPRSLLLLRVQRLLASTIQRTSKLSTRTT